MYDNLTLIFVGVVLLVLLIGATLLIMRNRRSTRLRSQFGPEYSRTVEDAGDRREAEAVLHRREKRVEGYSIRPLSASDRGRFLESWRAVQALFVDNPNEAVARADELLTNVMSARSYPMADFEQRSADLSVDHPVVLQNYRAAHEIAVKHERGLAGTEDLRQAMIHYRALFDELVDEPRQLRAKAS
jgi:hypothetical protein